MNARLYRTTLFALYQTSLAAGIVMLPLAVQLRRYGVTVPVHRLIETLERAYENAA